LCKSCRLSDTALSVLKEVTAADGTAAQEALHSVHHYGVCHGDISDDNILVFRDEAGASFATILDFGHSSIDADSNDMRAEAGQLAYLFAQRVSASPLVSYHWPGMIIADGSVSILLQQQG